MIHDSHDTGPGDRRIHLDGRALTGKSSTIVNVRNFLPLEKQSCKISIDQSPLGRDATGKGAVRIRDRIFFRFRRTFRSSSV